MKIDLLRIVKGERKFILYSLLAGLVILYAISWLKSELLLPGLKDRVLFALIVVVIIIIIDFLATKGFFSRIARLKESQKGNLNKILRFFTLKNTLLLVFALFLALTVLSFLKLDFFLSYFLASVQLPLVITTAIVWMVIYFLGRKDVF